MTVARDLMMALFAVPYPEWHDGERLGLADWLEEQGDDRHH